MPALPATNNLRTALTAPLSPVATTASVGLTSGFAAQGVFSVGDEVIAYTGKTSFTFTGLVRGYDGTLAASHATNDVCSLRIIAKHLNDAAFVNPNPVPVTIGGVSAGESFPYRMSVQEMLDRILYPYQYPSFSSLSLQGIGSPREVGDSIPASVTFDWVSVNPATIAPNTVDLIDVTGGNLVLATGIPDDGSEAVVMFGPIQLVAAGSYQFKIQALNTLGLPFSTLLTMQWQWRMFYGNSANVTLSEAQIQALANDLLTASYARTYAMAAGGYKYICLADAAGGQLNTVKDASTNLSVPMATAADDASYSNVDGGGYSYALVSVTNPFAVTTNYRVYRTKNSLGGAISLAVT